MKYATALSMRSLAALLDEGVTQILYVMNCSNTCQRASKAVPSRRWSMGDWLLVINFTVMRDCLLRTNQGRLLASMVS